MATVIRIAVLVLTAVFSTTNAQDFQGVATYKTKRKVDLKIDSTNTSLAPDMQKKMQEMLKKQFEKTFLLSFNREESVYKEDVSLETPGSGISVDGIQIKAFGGGGGSDVLYKNTKAGSFINQNELFGKIFLIKDSLETYQWQLEKDTKNIGKFTCYKATFKEDVEVTTSSFGNGNDDADSEPKTETRTRTVTAWYTPQIPINNGPSQFQGLPGLILEINDGEQQIICSQIVLNPENDISIKKPSKGKEVSKAEFDEIREKKLIEFQERYRPTGRESGETIQIRIGG
jgi:GLPGLI family protein